MICEKVVTQHIRKVRNPVDRKMAGVFAADILTKGNIAPDLWGALLQEVIALFELPVEEGDDEIVEPMMEGYSNATAILTYAAKATIDPLKENCPDPKVYLVQTLDKLNKANPGQVRTFSSDFLFISLLDYSDLPKTRRRSTGTSEELLGLGRRHSLISHRHFTCVATKEPSLSLTTIPLKFVPYLLLDS